MKKQIAQHGLLLLIVTTLLSCESLRADIKRFSALLSNGQRVEGQRLENWHQRAQMPKLDGTELMNEGNPLLWLRDRWLQPAKTPRAYVEMISGDRLPGKVIGFDSANGPRQWESLPPHLLVEPSIDVGSPRGESTSFVRVVSRYVRRIVWQSRPGGEDYHPGTVFYKDGRTIRFRAARFTTSSVKVIDDAGQTEVAFRDIAQLHLPREGAWESYLDELAVLSPSGRHRLLQVDTTDGLVATASHMQFSAMSRGNAGDSDNWYHGFQPAWCLDTLWARNSTIWMRRCWPIEKVPLSHILPIETQSRSIFSTGHRRWQRNTNVKRRALETAEHVYGWGYGVHAYSELHFPLPEYAIGFRTHVGLDGAVGEGGCVQAVVYAGALSEPPLYQSSYLTGAQPAADSGNINLANLPADRRRLILQVNPAHEGRPANTDPFDIRDLTDWLDPTVTLDRERLLTEVAARIPSRMAAFEGWNVHQSPEGDYKWVSDFQREDQSTPGNFAPQVHARNEPLLLSQKVDVKQDDRWLMVSAYRRRGDPPQPELIVRIDGIEVAASPIPLRSGEAIPTPLVVSLSPYVGHTIDLEVVQTASVDPGLPPVFWHGLKICEQLPVLYRVLEDEAELVSALPNSNAMAELITEDQHSGERSAAISRGGKFVIQFESPLQIRSNPEFGSQRFLRFASRKIGGGSFRMELLHEQSRERPAIYSAGVPLPVDDDFRETVWFDDALPIGATIDGTDGTDSFRWTTTDEGPVHTGKLAIGRRARGMQQQSFLAEQGLRVQPGDRLFAFVHCDARTPPRSVMLQFLTEDGKWRRAYWGEDVISLGKKGTSERKRLGDLPAPGKWVRLDVPIESLEIPGNTLITGWSLTQFDGALWWDTCGVRSPRSGPLFPATDVWKLELPDEWMVTTRDVFSDFGELDVTGVVLHVPDGQQALFDHIYFARKTEDFKLLPAAPSPEITNQQARRELAKSVLEKGHPATVAVLVDDRQATGVLVGGEGYVLTAGHVFGTADRDCEILLPSGQRLPAKTRGIYRGADLGVIQIIDRKDNSLPSLGFHDPIAFPSDRLYVYFPLEPFVAETPGATAHIVGVQRDFRETLWSDFHLEQATTGGPLLDREGRIIGTQIRDSRFGGFLYAKSFVAREHWDRMLRDEVWGDWFPGSGPMLGVDITSTRDGASITGIHAGSPADEAELKKGDIVRKVDGQSVASLDDVYRLLAKMNPGQEVAVELSRGDKTFTKNIKLMPRMP